MRRAVSIALVTLQVAAAAVLVLVVVQNYRLRRLVAARVVSAAGQFFAGDALPTVPVYDLAGRQKMLDLRAGRTTLAIVDPTCDSCAAAIRDAHGDPGVTLISPGPLKPVRDPSPRVFTTHGVALPKTIARKVQKYPQIMLVDRGTVVRVCATLNECRSEQMLAAAR